MLSTQLSVFLATLLLSSTSTVALGDFPCAGTSDSQTCAQWSVDPQRQGDISATATCQPDPINPSVSYCGYANAPCTTGADCDYGSCGSNGQCAGYAGDPCPNGQIDCQGFFFCGSDGLCGGRGAACANGLASSPIPNPDSQCLSLSCNNSTSICNAPPAAGVANDFACGNDDVCASKYCVPGTAVGGDLCAARPTASGRANPNNKAKRFVLNGSGPNVHECDAGHMACPVGTALSEGFECIDAMNNLEQCGGCVTDNTGRDCTAIPSVESVMCQEGACVILSCAPGFEVTADGLSCAAESS